MSEEYGEAVERLVERGPDMFMEPAEEESARMVALEGSVTDAVADASAIQKRSACAAYCIATLTRFVVRRWGIPLRAGNP